MSDYIEELVDTLSEDGFRLDGLLLKSVQRQGDLAVVIVPGLYASFSDAPYPRLARGLATFGFTCVIGNTRGHDFGAVLQHRDGALAVGGGGWERLVDSVYDIAGWVDYLSGRGHSRIALLGHSLGARKAAYYMAIRHDPMVATLIVASGHAAPAPRPDPELWARAAGLVNEGRGRDLIGWPEVGCSMSAQTYLDHEDPNGAFQNIFCLSSQAYKVPFVAQITCPIMAFFGGGEKGSDGKDRQDELEAIRSQAMASPRISTELIGEADHLYTGHEEQVAAEITRWLTGL